VDSGADIITDSGVKIQVKSASLYRNRTVYPNGAYWFRLGYRWKKVSGKLVRFERVYSQECDFVVLWGVDQNRFWIVPAAELDGHKCCVVGPESRWVEANLDAIRAARENGKSLRAIAADQGLTLGTTFNCLNGRSPSARTSLSSRIRECEGKWELIIGCHDTMREAGDTAIQVLELQEG